MQEIDAHYCYLDTPKEDHDFGVLHHSETKGVNYRFKQLPVDTDAGCPQHVNDEVLRHTSLRQSPAKTNSTILWQYISIPGFSEVVRHGNLFMRILFASVRYLRLKHLPCNINENLLLIYALIQCVRWTIRGFPTEPPQDEAQGRRSPSLSLFNEV